VNVSEVQSRQTVSNNPEEIPPDTFENAVSQTNPEEISLDSVIDELKKDSEQKDSVVNIPNTSNSNNNNSNNNKNVS
jgi:hypothetical protein